MAGVTVDWNAFTCVFILACTNWWSFRRTSGDNSPDRGSRSRWSRGLVWGKERQMWRGGGASPRAVALLQSCSLSPGQKIVLLHNRGPCTTTGREWRGRVNAPCCASALTHMKIKLRSQVCRGCSCAFNSYTRALVVSSRTVKAPSRAQFCAWTSPPTWTSLRPLGWNKMKPTRLRRARGSPWATRKLTRVYVTCMTRPLPLG